METREFINPIDIPPFMDNLIYRTKLLLTGLTILLFSCNNDVQKSQRNGIIKEAYEDSYMYFEKSNDSIEGYRFFFDIGKNDTLDAYMYSLNGYHHRVIFQSQQEYRKSGVLQNIWGDGTAYRPINSELWFKKQKEFLKVVAQYNK